MPIQTWEAFDLLVDDVKRDRSGLRELSVRLLGSPAGGHDPIGRKLPLERSRKLTERLTGLANRDINQAGVIDLGETLADLLLPGDVRQAFAASLDGLASDAGLRVILRLEPTLAEIPWEYAWVARQRGQRDASGFLALHPRVSMVREETVKGRASIDPAPRDRRVVALLADPAVEGMAPLDLELERRNLETALDAIPGMTADIRVDATMDDLSDALAEGADVLHFAGHGEADRLYLVDADEQPWPLRAEQLAINVRARGVQLVVLGACESGTRDRAERWSGVATRLLAERVPAVVAMQYLVNDGMAIAFSKGLYRSLAAGWSLDEAVGAGRLAMYNHATGGYRKRNQNAIWPDWGVPVLYARPDVVVSLASVEAPDECAGLEEELVQAARIRTAAVEKGGRVVGASGASGIIDVKIETGDVAGQVVGSEDFEGAKADVDVTTGSVTSGGEVVGIQGPTSRSRRRRRP
jgi:hypothetical protein